MTAVWLRTFKQWSWQRIAAAALLAAVGTGITWMLVAGYQFGPRVTVQSPARVGHLPEPQPSEVLAGSATAPTPEEAVQEPPASSSAPTGAGAAASSAEEKSAAPGRAAPADLSRVIWPVEGEVARGYGYGLADAYRDYRFHPGVDLAAPSGSPVRAVARGEVKEVAYDAEHRWQVVLSHGNGWETVYLELDRVEDLSAGQPVPPGSVLGYLGEPGTGAETTEPHLHFEVRYRGEARNPLEFLR